MPWSIRTRWRSRAWWAQRAWSVQGLAAAALLVIGVGIGHLLPRRVRLRAERVAAETGSLSEIAAMRNEMRELREMVSLSLMQQQSASERLKGVSWTSQIDQPGGELVLALLDALMHDPNVNVRLATIDALERFAVAESCVAARSTRWSARRRRSCRSR